MNVVILAGGQGTRLRPYTTILPKPLVPIGDGPILELILRQLAAAEVTKVHLCVGHLGELIRVYFSEATKLPKDLVLEWHWEETPLGTAGPLRLVPEPEETFIAMNGDVVTSLDYRELVAFHRQQQATMTVATHTKQIEIDLGVIESEAELVTCYREKPSLTYDVSMGIYVLEPAALRHIPEQGPFQIPELVQSLLGADECVATYKTKAEWYDIGTILEYEQATEEIEARPELFGL